MKFPRIPAAAAAALALLLSGCATLLFTPLRTALFVSEHGTYATVDYGRLDKARESIFTTSTGVRLPFKSKLKVRVETPDGDRFVAYQRMSAAGMLYVSDNEEWEYFERGTSCLIARSDGSGNGYVPIFQGVFCKQLRQDESVSKRSAGRTGSTPHGFKAPSSGPGESSGPRESVHSN